MEKSAYLPQSNGTVQECRHQKQIVFKVYIYDLSVQVITGCRGACETIIDHTHRVFGLQLINNWIFNCLEISDYSQVTIRSQHLQCIVVQTNASIDLLYATRHYQWTWVCSLNTTRACKEPQSRRIYQDIKLSMPVRWIIFLNYGVQNVAFQVQHPYQSIISLYSTQFGGQSPRNFQYVPKRQLSVLFGAKRTSDSSSAPQHCLESIYLSLAGHLSSCETSNNRAVLGATFRNIYFRTRLLPYVLYGDFREVSFDECYLQNYLTKFSRTKFIRKPKE